MQRETITTDQAPAAFAAYSQAIAAGDFVFCSGQIGVDPQTREFTGDDIASQTRQALTNLSAVLTAAGSSLDQAVKATVFLADINDFAAFNEVYTGFFTADPPARSTFAVKDLPVGAKIEIEMIAVR